ncbi:SDR family NAD(P)-dependent oxidoreductase [Limosilactobacillus sp.]|jgi:3-oxoacyl-[acyl-carrier protein] reductase|uniref:SDR family NAD(P)-dependent oxidoreductase n=1 Tax=Limosilactobacillus sp. TaxID=2773925 RepID=UPI0025C05588|nr:SDR family oxidoreductase [Limosilactobacillus sp.]MCH3921947.1 SDR family oxidoreductase [Limosilactobacillus sp.]MCH3928718.1 SDR family oxidoreductase [Limosilactobacillus sp.]
MAKERVCLITGSSGGIATAICQEMAKTCKTIIGFEYPGVNQDHVKQLVEAEGAEFIGVGVDISDEESVKKGFEVVKKIGRLDILGNIAAIAPNNGPNGMAYLTDQTPLDEWKKVIDVNLTGTFLVTRAALPYMMKNKWGRIISVMSQTARHTTYFAGASYPASKGGVSALTRTVASQYGRYGITANLIAPGWTKTPMLENPAPKEYIDATPLGRVAVPADDAPAFAFLASEGAGFITGITIDINGGFFIPL